MFVDFFTLETYPAGYRGNEKVPAPYGAQYPIGWTWKGFNRALKRGLFATGYDRVIAVHRMGLYRTG